MTTKPTESTPAPVAKKRSIEHQAATACQSLSRLDLAIVRASEALTTKRAERDALVKGLEPAVRTLVERMRPPVAVSDGKRAAE